MKTMNQTEMTLGNVMAFGKMKGFSCLILAAWLLLAVTVGTAFAGPNNFGTLSSAAGPLTADGSQQTVATITTSQSGGGNTVTSFTILLGGTVTAGDVTGVYFTNGTNTWSATGSYGSGSSVVCSGSAKPGASTYSINVTLAGTAAGKTVSVQLTTETPSSGGTGIPTGTSSALAINAPPASNTYGSIVDGTGPLTADLSQQTVATVPVTPVNGGLAVTSYTVAIGGSVTSGDVTGVYVTDGTATWSATGSYGNGSSVPCAGPSSIPGATLTIKVTLAASADAKTVSVTLANDSNSAGTLPQGPSTALSISAPAGPVNQLTSCSDCHTYPPTDDTVRNASTGATIGSHTAHNAYTCDTCHVVPSTETSADFDHRSGTIQMAASIQGGYYDKNGNATNDDGPFNQTDSPTPASCENVACHNNSTTPAWGGTATCDTCHGLPPATNAHTAHFTAKGWSTGVTTNCTACHPDNEAVSHSSVTDGAVEVVLTHSSTGTATTCSSWANGCHNDAASTPTWGSTGITCSNCHTIGGTNSGTVANPASGLHDETPVVSGVIHNPTDPNFSGCEDCHTSAPSASHWSGTVETPSTFAANLNYAAGSPATCAATCHSDAVLAGESWARKWHEDSDQTTSAACAGCHGDWTNGWNAGVTHRTDADPQGTHGTGTNYECKDCHGLEAATGYTFTLGGADWGGGSNHGNGQITMNAAAPNGASWGRSGGLSGCSNCHNAYDGTDGAANQHSFTQTGWATPDQISGDTINAGCDSCHGGSGQYWPNGSTYPDRAGRHDIHITRLAAKLAITLPGSDAEQKAMCDYCHNDPAGAGGSGHNDSGTPVEPANVGAFNKLWDATADGTGTYTSASQTCAIACHNGKTTTAGTFGWRDSGTSICTLCHTAGGGVANEIINPTSGLHAANPRISGQAHDDTLDASGCVICHTASPSSAHINGTGDTSSPTITLAGSTGFSDATTPTCANNCHADGSAWGRKWHGNSEQSNGTECAGCHGTFATGFNSGVGLRHQTSTSGDAGGQIEANHDGTDKCYRCHSYKAGDTTYYNFATLHRDNKIQISNQVGFADNGTTVGCGGCHSSSDGTADGGHEFSDVTSRWTLAMISGPAPSCTGCHSAAGSGAAGVGPNSPHSNDTAAGGGVYDCAGCHTAHKSGTVEIPNNSSVGINFSANGESGIALGGSQASGTTEAEICWNCHNANGVSEWGTNTQAATGNSTYNYGTLSQLNWNGATWTSGTAAFSYKTGPIQSTHGTNGGGSGVDALSKISCTYCHDVHDTNKAPGDTLSGKPYLRGSWRGNPYKEDGAPQANTVYATGGKGAVPRASKAAVDSGGYYIDANSGNPTSAWTPTQFGGLCDLCHGQTKDGVLNGAEIDVLNVNGNEGSAGNNPAWVSGYNGHKNSVKGGSGPGSGAELTARNIFNARGGTAYTASTGTDNVLMNHMFASSTTQANTQPGWDYDPTPLYGFRGQKAMTGLGSGLVMSGQPNFNGLTDWGVDMRGTTTDANYHQFSCSKCHNPHASRLPKLMITNCLDTKQNTWDNGNSGTNATPLNPYSGINLNRSMSNWSSAQNCHRLANVDTHDARADQAGTGNGWNKVTPWTDSDAYGSGSAPTQDYNGTW